MTRLCDLLPPSSTPVPSVRPNPLREEIYHHVAEYLARGGQIKVCTADDNRMARFDNHRSKAEMNGELKRATWEQTVRKQQCAG